MSPYKELNDALLALENFDTEFAAQDRRLMPRNPLKLWRFHRERPARYRTALLLARDRLLAARGAVSPDRARLIASMRPARVPWNAASTRAMWFSAT